MNDMKFQIVIISLLLLDVGGFAQERQVIRGTSEWTFIHAGKERDAKTIREIPDLVIRDEVFSDPDENNLINANETTRIIFVVENLGEGKAEQVAVNVRQTNADIRGLRFTQQYPVGDILPGERKSVEVPVAGQMSLENGIATFHIEAREHRGFDAYPLEMKIETRSFQPPRVAVVDGVFGSRDGGKLELNQFITLRFIVQNLGLSNASGVKIKVFLPEECPLTSETAQFDLPLLAASENQQFDVEFVATRRYQQDHIPVRVLTEESFGKYGHDTTFVVWLDQNLLAQKNVVIAPVTSTEVAIQKATLTSDVDRNIPVNPKTNQKRFALIIGNEDYHKYQRGLSTEMNVDYARNDARVFREYVTKTLGFPEENVYLLLDATSGEMGGKLELISKLVAKAGSDAELIFYYAGHGLPSEVTRIPYLIPVDVTGSNLDPAIKLSDVLEKLGSTGAQRVTIILDACFSGGGRTSGLLAARSIRIKPTEAGLEGNTVVFSATSGEQSALPYHAEHHGMFTYYLLKKLQETAGKVTYRELADYLVKTVSYESLKINEKEQDPEVRTSVEVMDEWRGWGIIN